MSDEKKVTAEISIDADADAVWRALSEGEEIKRWFSPEARVTPGVGGAVWLSWGEGADWEAPIEIWEPKRHLRTVDPAPSKLAVDYFIESKGGETVLRIVHSGFAADAWDDEIDTLNAGWRTFAAEPQALPRAPSRRAADDGVLPPSGRAAHARGSVSAHARGARRDARRRRASVSAGRCSRESRDVVEAAGELLRPARESRRRIPDDRDRAGTRAVPAGGVGVALRRCRPRGAGAAGSVSATAGQPRRSPA